jgi:signal transduction histidine kinase
MKRLEWLPRQSLLLLIASALILPAVVAIAVGFATAQSERQNLHKGDAMAVARQMVDVADAEVSADLRILHILGFSEAISARDWPATEGLLRLSLQANPTWKALVIRDPRTGEVLKQVGRGNLKDALYRLPGPVPERGLTEGAFHRGRYCPCVILHRLPAGNPDLVISLFVDPGRFQNVLMERVRLDTIAAIVDREGRFVARSRDYRKRVGTPATIYVRKAAKEGGEGFYEGRTFEGFENYSAYSTSRLTGWSAHVAIDRAWLDGPQSRFAWAVVMALSAALLLAIALVLYAAHDARIRRREHARFLRLQKSEVIAQFTSIVVHDMRNLLAASYAGLSQIEKHTTESSTRLNVERVRDVVRRGEKLINRLLSFARTGSQEVGSVDLAAVLENSEELLRQILGGAIAYSWSIASDMPRVRGNADQLELALINLAKNARDAMDGKGTFSIKVSRVGDMVQILVDDDGPGVPPEIGDHAFDAFFTTKASGAGTGLGLAQVVGTVRQSDGQITLEKSPAGGARFRVLLPLNPD